MTNPHQQILDDNNDVIKLFLMRYIADRGVQVQLLEVITKELYGRAVTMGVAATDAELSTTPRTMLSTAVEDVINFGVLGNMHYDLTRVIEGAVSFEFLVRYAHKLNPAIMPADVIPSDEVVATLLELFHEANRQSLNPVPASASASGS